MTKKKLIKLHSDFFKAEGLEFECSEFHPSSGKVMYDGLTYYIITDPKRNHAGMCFHMFAWGPEFPQWEGSPYWDDDPELEGKVKSAANRVNGHHDPGKVNPDSTVTYSIEIPLQSPGQFKDFFYKAAHELKAVESDFMDELINMGVFESGAVTKDA